MTAIRVLSLYLCLLNVDGKGYIDLTRKWKYYFPEGSSAGIFLAVALPLELPKKNAYMAYNFEANYKLPFNNTADYEYPPVVQRKINGIDRQLVYDIIEAKMNSNGLSGKDCLLRTICEAATLTVDNNGVLGDILHIIITPSTTKNSKNISSDYEKAELAGKSGNCKQYNKKCVISLLNVISWIGNAL